MTGQELTTLIGALGFPIVLVLGLLWFVKKDVWPWFVSDQKQRREVESIRHTDYIKTYERSAASIEILTRTLIEFSTLVKEQHEQQSETASSNHGTLINVIEKNHTEVIHRLDKIDGKVTNGFGVKR